MAESENCRTWVMWATANRGSKSYAGFVAEGLDRGLRGQVERRVFDFIIWSPSLSCELGADRTDDQRTPLPTPPDVAPESVRQPAHLPNGVLGHRNLRSGFDQSQFRIPEFKILVVVVEQNQEMSQK